MGNVLSDRSRKFRGFSKSRKIKTRRKDKSQRNSSMSSTMSSSTDTGTSRSSQISYRYIDGRRYNEKSKYALPNDDAEIDRLHLQHYLQRSIWQRNFCAPVHKILKHPGAKVLDVGCGPGTWLLEMSFDYPQALFTGIDISPMYPQEIKPVNVNFEEADLTAGLPFPDNTFDFVVMRNMINALSVKEWEFSLRELERVCKPGGFVECLEFELPAVRIGTMTEKMLDAYIQIMRTKNIDITIAPRMEGLFTTCTTLTNINHQTKIVPMGKWGDKVGEIMAEDLILVSKAMAPTLTPLWGIGTIQYQEYIDGITKELDEGNSYCSIHVIFAQKYEQYGYI